MKNDFAIIREVCSVCGQGRILVADSGNKDFYLLCEDCESEWEQPELTKDYSMASHNKHTFIEYVSVEELYDHQWFDLVINK